MLNKFNNIKLYFNFNQNIYDFLSNQSLIDDIKNIKKFEYVNSKNIDLDYISEKYLDDINLWWVLALYNDIIDPFTKDNKDIIKVPNSFILTNILGEHLIKKEYK
jgi:hypothetical protein